MARILIIRFSALGDVAMTIPVIHSLAVQYPQHEITVLSRAVWQPLFQEAYNLLSGSNTGIDICFSSLSTHLLWS